MDHGLVPEFARPDRRTHDLPIDLTEHDIERSKDRNNISKHVPLAHHVHGLKLLKPVGLILQRSTVRAVSYEISAKLALGSFALSLPGSAGF